MHAMNHPIYSNTQLLESCTDFTYITQHFPWKPKTRAEHIIYFSGFKRKNINSRLYMKK